MSGDVTERWFINTEWLYYDSFGVYVVRQADNEKQLVQYALPTLVKLETNLAHEPTFRLTSDGAQQLINELWRVGVRPKDGSSSLAHVDAMKAHLEDMRKLVFEVRK